jgi:diguanylate cyclase (GGDEF)-like protein
MQKMEHNDKNAAKQIGGIPANRIATPVIIILLIFHILVIFLFFSISRQSQKMSMIMQKTAEYTSDASDMMGGSSLLSETATNFILMPVNENGDINYSPLMAYAAEIKKDRRGPQIAERFETYAVSDEDRMYINEAAEAADAMMNSQLHALALMNTIYPFTDVPALASIPLPDLSEKELAYSNEKKEVTARQLILGTEYALNKQTVSTDVSACAANLKKESSASVAAANTKVNQFRLCLWVVTICIILLLAFIFITIYQQILVPMKNITRSIRSNEPLTTIRGLREVREMAYAYNGLLRRRNTLDSILRSAAETDTLTNLPNRYAFRQYLMESSEEGYSLALLMFDVNYLKQTNDTLGHKAGDDLLKQSAECIATCFGSAGENNCFRLGGDEFAAVIKNPTTELLDNEIKLFLLEQRRRHLSIAFGYALASEIVDASTFEELIEAADKKMYEQKKKIHGVTAVN